MQNPGPAHQLAADRVIRYLDGIRTYALEFGGICEATINIFEGSSDASFADMPDRKSSEGRHYMLFGGSIDWKAGVQTTVGRSTTEVELKALSNAGVDLIWWKRLFIALNLDIDHTPWINCDNLQTVGIVNKSSNKLVTKLKHIDIHQHWLRQEVKAESIAVRWVPTSEMRADGFTKSLGAQKHAQFVQQMNLVDIQQRIIQENE